MTTATIDQPSTRRSIVTDRPAPRPVTDDQPPAVWPKWAILEREKWNHQLATANRRIEELEGAILMSNQEHRRALSIYGSPNALEEVTKQVSLAPQFKGLTADEHRFVAGVGLASGLNPVFHLHAWKQDEWNPETRAREETLHIVPDYKALIASVPDPIMTSERRLSVDEMRARGIAEDEIAGGAIAYEVTGTNLKHAIMARQAGIDYTPKKGFGWWAATKEETEWKKVDGKNKKVPTGKRIANDTPAGRDGEWVARKRAMRDLFNQLADLRLKFVAPAGGHVQDDEWVMGEVDEPAPDIINGEYTVQDAPKPSKSAWLTDEAETKAVAYADKMSVTDAQINEALSVDDWRYAPISPEEYKAVVDHLAESVITVEEAPASPEPVEPPAESAEPVTPVTPEPPAETSTPPVEEPTPEVAPVAVEKCMNCGIDDADPTNPVEPTWCTACASRKADKAAKSGK